jgi:hypothetical protein
MSLWMLLVLIGLLKLLLVGLMIWMPFRHDEAMRAPEARDAPDSSEEDGGSHTLPAGPRDPHPRMPLPHSPRRDPHGSPALPAPARVRTPLRAMSVKSIGQTHPE